MNDTVNQRIIYAIANQVAVDLLGHREMHARRVSLPVVAPSRVPVRRDVQRGGFTPLARRCKRTGDTSETMRHE